MVKRLNSLGNTEFRGVELGNGHINLQAHRAKKIIDTPVIRDVKAL